LSENRPVIALTGATGYVGGLLIRPLSEVASELRCITRNPSRLVASLPDDTSAVKADVGDHTSLLKALSGCDIAFYLVHSLNEGKNFSLLEAEAASTFAVVAKQAGIKRIIYLGALAQSDSSHTSAHIESRHRVGEILRSTGVPVTEFRASVIIGAGSMPFEAIRALVERLPVMVTPRWVRMPVQPIFYADLVKYMVSAVGETGSESHVYEIGASDVTSYADLMRTYARQRGLKRFMVPVPVITPRLSSMWLKLVTPAHYRIGKNIVDSTAHSSVVADESAGQDFDITPISVDEAVKQALRNENDGLAFLDETERPESDSERMRSGTKFVERRRIEVNASESSAFDAISHIGGKNGWFWGDWLWKVRGMLDRAVGGPGMRLSQTQFPPKVGEQLDFWTVQRIDGNRITLKADMRLPGEAWLDLKVFTDDDRTYIEQTAAFDPKGLFGLVYWFGLYPMHTVVFSHMLSGAKRVVESKPHPDRS
jgi:uncharacterized protein YbjT (DUF2867 family)